MKSTAIDSLIKRYSKEERDNLSGDEIFFDKSGHIFKQTLDQFGRKVWTILSNQNNCWGWYFVDSPYVDTTRSRDGMTHNIEPNENKLHNYTIHSKYISYFINDRNQIILFLYTLKDGLLAFITLHKYPTWQNLIHTSYIEWADEYDLSHPLRNLPLINPQSFDQDCSDSWEQIDWDTDKELDDWNTDKELDDWNTDKELDDWNQPPEYRMDFDGNWYTKKEFYEYYGSYIQWGFQHPLNINRRILLSNIISQETNAVRLNCLIDKLIDI